MASLTKLIAQLTFVDVPDGQQAILPHGLTDGNGAKLVPDECKRSNRLFAVTADDTNVTVTNNSGQQASVSVQAEHYHSVIRQLGGLANLPIQPWVSDSD